MAFFSSCLDPSFSLPDEADADPNSFIALECDTTKKFSAQGSFANLVPDKIYTEHFKDIANILKSGYFGKKVDGDKTKVSLDRD